MLFILLLHSIVGANSIKETMFEFKIECLEVQCGQVEKVVERAGYRISQQLKLVSPIQVSIKFTSFPRSISKFKALMSPTYHGNP